MTAARIDHLVSSARRRLEALRLLKAAARGVLMSGVFALPLLLAAKAIPSFALAASVPWLLCLAGAVAAVVVALRRARVTGEAAALYLDRRFATKERISTLWSRPDNPFAARLEQELHGVGNVPRLPFPREAAFLPAALFLLFAAGLLPAARGEEPLPAGASASRPAASAEGGPVVPRPLGDVRDAVRLLHEGAPMTAEQKKRLQEAIERGVTRPEDRRAARDALNRAEGGDASAAKEVAAALAGVTGGEGVSERGTAPGAAAGPGDPRARAKGAGLVYPEHEEFLRAYRRAISMKEGDR